MTGSQKKRICQRFRDHRNPVRTFRGDPTRPAYTLYCLWKYPTYLAAANELDELIEQWPRNQARTVALLAVRAAFFENGATHWDVETVHVEDQENIHALMLQERRRKRAWNAELCDRYEQHYQLAEAAFVESQRRKQGPPTGSPKPSAPRGRVKTVQLWQIVGQVSKSAPSALQRVDELVQQARLSSRASRV
jgi:hypothetical protein